MGAARAAKQRRNYASARTWQSRYSIVWFTPGRSLLLYSRELELQSERTARIRNRFACVWVCRVYKIKKREREMYSTLAV